MGKLKLPFCHNRAALLDRLTRELCPRVQTMEMTLLLSLLVQNSVLTLKHSLTFIVRIPTFLVIRKHWENCVYCSVKICLICQRNDFRSISNMFTERQRSCGQVNVYTGVCQSVHTDILGTRSFLGGRVSLVPGPFRR